MKWKSNVLVGAAAFIFSTGAFAEITLYQGESFRGRALTTAHQIQDLARTPFADRAGSVVVDGGEWEVCDSPQFGGRCVTLRAGSYDSASSMGLDYGIASVRGVIRHTSDQQVVPPPLSEPTYAFRQRPHERIYDARVMSARAVLGPTDQRCWVEREQVVERDEPNGKGALAGAIIGGILGHEIGHGKGAATAGGALAGAAIGATVGRDGDVYDQDVQHCVDVPPGPPQYWDVTYEFRGIMHRVQMTDPPGPTITVNSEGEPRQ